MYRKQIPRGANSLFKAISEALYFTTQQHSLIGIMLVQYLDKLIEADLIPPSLSIFKSNHALKMDYSQQPNFPGFDNINLQLVSMMFRVKVNLYSIIDGRLSCKIINNNYIRMIELCRDENNHYDSVYVKEFIQNAAIVQQLIYEIINKSTDNINGFIPKLFKNIEMDNWIQDKSNQITPSRKNRSNSEQKKSNFTQVAVEIETLKTKQIESDTTQDQILNLKTQPPGLLDAQSYLQKVDTPNKKPLILEESEQRYNGRLKFFDESKSYGFIVLDTDNSDIFVHLDDLQKAGITKEYLRGLGSYFRSTTQVNHFGKGPSKAPLFSFQMMTYMGKYNRSRKAIDLRLIPE